MSFLDPTPIILTRDGRDGFPAEVDFNEQVEDYLMGLNPKKRAKALSESRRSVWARGGDGIEIEIEVVWMMDRRRCEGWATVE